MYTHWKDIAKRVALRMDLTEEEGLHQVKTFYQVARDGVKHKKKIDFDFLIGKIVPISHKMNAFYESLKDKVDNERRPEFKEFVDYFHKWQELVKEGRWKVKGQHNPFKKE